MEEELFTKQMRKATLDIHQISDAMVNAKLGFALSDSSVWADGLLVFYEVFAYLESAMDRACCPLLADFDITGLRRREAFEADLTHYLGSEWRLQKHRPAVRAYLEHLEKVEQENPTLLLAYIYHLYMGLLSGGQILRRKRAFFARLLGRSIDGGGGGSAVTTFDHCRPSEMKRHLASTMNICADSLDDQTKQLLLVESRRVFALNNTITASVRGVNSVLQRRLLLFLLFLAVCVCIVGGWLVWS